MKLKKQLEIELDFNDVMRTILSGSVLDKERIIEELYHSDGLCHTDEFGEIYNIEEPENPEDDMTLDESSKYNLFRNNSHKFTYEELENFFNTK